ncbi:hypothetical protein Aam_066_027 [Acidocella aminolytica 101 = DSM 11237]|jgi:hypothetical protein|uniref:Uncharacterized protein n=1 Tax=Acidocella aminolytica 101 = DSM 11237 TaxID=1120923 RepID=A0A0D6PIC7_9PROT|nr:hypothetical protein Aam_066_027 [Acidocella aminolytica 101 = DSM 11237]GBQ37152.1 hypothetical protein AA11237_1446 [Acidocella aminolytica 101 = DSM 11237]
MEEIGFKRVGKRLRKCGFVSVSQMCRAGYQVDEGILSEKIFVIVAAAFCLKDKKGKCGSVAVVNRFCNGTSRR